MNIYRILTFDGCSSRCVYASGFDIISAIQTSGVPINEVIRAELIGAEEIETHSQTL